MGGGVPGEWEQRSRGGPGAKPSGRPQRERVSKGGGQGSQRFIAGPRPRRGLGAPLWTFSRVGRTTRTRTPRQVPYAFILAFFLDPPSGGGCPLPKLTKSQPAAFFSNPRSPPFCLLQWGGGDPASVFVTFRHVLRPIHNSIVTVFPKTHSRGEGVPLSS